MYQADWLLRFYGFGVEELTTVEEPDLPLGMDPKLAWALRQPEQFPVDLHTAPRERLLRVPGLGVRNVDRLLAVRRWHRVTLADLARLRVPLKKIMPFVVTADHRPHTIGDNAWRETVQRIPRQMELFAPDPGTFLRADVEYPYDAAAGHVRPHFRGLAARRPRRACWRRRRPIACLWQELGRTSRCSTWRTNRNRPAARAVHRQGAEEICGDRHPRRLPPIRSGGRCSTGCSGASRTASTSCSPSWSITDVHALTQMDKAIRHDVHKMRAFVRFRTVEHGGSAWYVAWFEPAHHIVELNAPFFVDRFAQMRWSILTPDRCAHWDGSGLSFTEGVPKSEAPVDDAVEPLWQKYYANIFNPARVKVHAMTGRDAEALLEEPARGAADSGAFARAPARG